VFRSFTTERMNDRLGVKGFDLANHFVSLRK
jgi:hypothetical protein